MKIGEKIKKLRTSKLMTQSDLVGGEITRNMLSQIENGSANPSLDTVRYIASRLNVSVGYLLSEGAEERMYLKHGQIEGIKKAFMNEDYLICRDMCLNSENMQDDELRMILCECDLALGIEAFCDGRLYSCIRLLDEAIEGCADTVYRTDYVVAAAGVYFRYIRRISAVISSNVIDESEVNVYPALTEEFCRYVYVFERMDESGSVTEGEIMSIGKEDSPYVLHLLARRAIENGEFQTAHRHLKAILLGEARVPQPMLYFVFSDLEIACKEIEDFKGAYEYSKDKLELKQKLLSRSDDYS